MTTTTLTWASSGNGTKTGTTAVDLLNNLDTLITSKSGDATFSWEKAGKNVAGNNLWLLLRRKDGSAGRIALLYYLVAPAAGNAAIFGQTPSANALFITYFPAGTGTTLSNLAASSGTMCGTDTGSVQCANGYDVSVIYTTNIVPFYFDSYDGCYFLFNDPSTNTPYCVGAGALLEDTLTATAVNGAFGSFVNNMATMASNGFGTFTMTSSLAGALDTGWRANYPSSTVSKQFFQQWTVTTWVSQVPSTAGDVLSDPANNRYYYAPITLLGQTRGEGGVLKIRQVAFGSGSSNAFQTYSTTGPVVQARMMCNATAGGVQTPWVTNFKV